MSGDAEDKHDESGNDSFLRAVATSTHAAPTAAQAGVALGPGKLIAGRFRLERRLGEGGMGVVWSARHVVTRKPVALKFLKSSATPGEKGARQRFLREARAASAVRHPSVVEVHDVLELEDGSPVMVMDLLEGETFAALLAREGALPLPDVARIMVPVCAAVGSAHALGIVHRDLKPDNIFLAVEGDRATSVKVLDFGIAKLTATEGDAAHSGATTGTGVLLGTPFYMAPEQVFGEKDVDHRADLWAVGVILYEALAGRRPTQGANLGQIFKLVTKEGIVPLRELVPSLPAPVLDLVSRLLEQERDRRPADLREVLAVLSEHTSTVAEPFGVPRPVQDLGAANEDPGEARKATLDALPLPRRWPRWVGIGVVASGVIGVASLSLLRGPAASTPTGLPATSAPPPPSLMPPPATLTPTASAPAATIIPFEAGSPAPVASSSASPASSAHPTVTTVQRSPAPRTRPAVAATAPASPAASSPPPPRPAATTPKMSEDL